MSYSLAIDPGWKNLGIALVEKKDGLTKLVTCATLNPSDFGEIERCSRVFNEVLGLTSNLNLKITHIQIERYVSYQNVNTAEAENILMLIGGLVERARQQFPNADIMLTRAIDWKMEVVKTLYKTRDFKNPSDKLDKKFSIAAANACLDTKPTFKTDHEADAIVLSALPYLREELQEKQRKDSART